jgi:Tol biopolymer transport system component
VDGGTSQPIGISATATLNNVVTGAHSVQLTSVAANCSVGGTNPLSVTVFAGATAEVGFAVTCTATTGSLEITTTTTGGLLDPDGYTVAVDDGTAQAIETNTTLTLPGVGAGAHRVTLSGLATNCRVEGENPRLVTVAEGTATVAFSLACMSRIAFARSTGQGSDIYIMNADGTGQTRITSGTSPAWSPDGKRIAFTSTSEGNAEIYVMKADGTEVSRLTNHPFYDLSPTWSPDGTRIAFRRIDLLPDDDEFVDFDEIMVMEADGSGVLQVTASTDPEVRYGAPDWSRDGRRIAFEEWIYYESPARSIAVINPDGTGLQYASRYYSDAGDFDPAWSTDGRIAFSHWDYLDDREIYVMNADGSGQIQLTNNPADDLDPAWSRDDRKIAFTSGRGLGIYVKNVAGSGVTRLTSGYDLQPTWSP